MVWNRNAFPQSRVDASHTFDKMDNLHQKCCHRTLSTLKNLNFQSNEDTVIAYFFAQALLPVTYFNTMVWLENTFDCQLPVKNRKIFLPGYTHPIILSVLNIAKLLSSWMFETIILCMLETLKTMLGMIWDMLHFVHLYDIPYILFSIPVQFCVT